NNAIHLPWDMWCNLDFSARTTGNSENLYVKSQWGCNLSFFKSFANDKFTIKLQLNDVFNTMKTGFILYDAISLTRMEKIYDTRDLQIVFTYNYNSARSRYKGRGSGNNDKGRL
ncbi:MAG: outer membrane beta-barrel protein, partial [Muribaculaceae bacterium]|nr:outer membrane beta-barrel protein [Muribaculaceae bacterium]